MTNLPNLYNAFLKKAWEAETQQADDRVVTYQFLNSPLMQCTDSELDGMLQRLRNGGELDG